MISTRIPQSFAPHFTNLLATCAASSHVYRSMPESPLIVGTQHALRSRAHQLLALELTSWLASGDRDFDYRDRFGVPVDQAFRDLQDGTSVGGGENVADFYSRAAATRYTGSSYGAGQQVPSPNAWQLGDAIAGAQQLELDVAASAAADVLLDAGLAAQAVLLRDAALAKYHGILSSQYPGTRWF